MGIFYILIVVLVTQMYIYLPRLIELYTSYGYSLLYVTITSNKFYFIY